ncbi:MAG: hypothetical protein OEX12_09710 [Gammaproteobacteria bacterium]|nr:hypothetical protein [Gammaproteobacteria bacterium]
MDIQNKLGEIVVRLYQETDGYQHNPSEVQLWYNRGYANGVLSVLRAQAAVQELASNITLDDADIHCDDRLMEWEKAYHHGFEMGEREAKEVLPTN